MYQLPATLSEDIKYYSTLVDEFLVGKLEPVKFKAIRVPMGIYEQRKNGTYMVRIRCAGGFITPHQLKKVAEIAIKHHSQILHITTRQEIQIQNVDLRDTVSILQNLKETGLSSKGGGGNTVRNVMASVDSGIAHSEIFDVAPYAYNLTSRLIAEPDSFTLPRKLKMSFSNSSEDTGYAAFNDLGFIAKIKDGKRGFEVLLGGSLALKPMVSYKLFDFAPEDDLFYIADAAKKLFSRYGNRKNKHKARLRYVFYKLGKEEVFRLFFEIYNEIKVLEAIAYKHSSVEFSKPDIQLQTDRISGPEFHRWKERYTNEQRQKGLFSVIVPFDNGNSSPEVFLQIAAIAAHFGEDVIRFSMRQNLHLRNIPEAYLGYIYKALIDAGINIHVPVLLNTVVACTGADTCRLGICMTKDASKAIRKELVKSDLQLDKLKDIRINISGCPNSCGQHSSADLGFFGKVGRNDRMYPAYYVVAGAVTGTEPKLSEITGDVSARDLPKFVADVFRIYLNKQHKHNSFGEYFAAEGKSDIAQVCLKYNDIPEFSEDKNYYFDWGSDQIFSLAARGVGECSAGLFDMIDVDLNTINLTREKLDGVPDISTTGILLYTLVFASSRMLLITRGAEPRNETEVFEAFLEKFVDAKLVSSVYREIIETAREKRVNDLIQKKETILELAQTVINLYEGMDDSLQFRNPPETESAKETPVQATVKKKDFRGVACPMNFVKTKIELAGLKSGDILEILLDDGEPIENVPGSIRGEGHKILEQKKVDNYWIVNIEKA